MPSATVGPGLASIPAFTPLLSTGTEPEWSDEHDVRLSDSRTAKVARLSLLHERATVTAITFGFAKGTRTDFKVAFTEVPETIGFMPNLLCHPKDWFATDPANEPLSIARAARAVAGLETEYRRVRVADPRFRRRYHLKVDADVGETWTAELFSPRFLDWCATKPPAGFGFELTNGWLATFVCLDLNAAPGFDELTAATSSVEAFLRSETEEERGLPGAGLAALSDRGERQLSERLRERVNAVHWSSPPQSERRAARSYLPRCLINPRFWLAAALVGSLFIIVGALGDHDARSWFVLATGIAFVLLLVWQSASWDAWRLGRLAFASEFAKSRGLQLEDPRLFQARNTDLDLHAVVDEALTGELAPGLVGTLALLHGTGNDAGNFYDAVIADVTDPNAPLEPVLGQRGQVVRGGKLMVWWPVGVGGRSLESLDHFLADTARRYGDLVGTALAAH